MSATALFLSPPLTTTTTTLKPLSTTATTATFLRYTHHFPRLTLKRNPFRVHTDDGGGGDDGEAGDPDDYDMDDEEVEELDNKVDYDVEYERGGGEDDEVGMMVGESNKSSVVVMNRGWEESEKVVEYRINEDEFHKICLMDCDFFIRKPPDPDNDVFDFREMYVTPPDTDVYSIPKVLAPMPQKYIRCAKSDYGCYNVTEPPIDAPRDPLYKSEREVLKVFLTKHYRNRRLGDPDFVLDFEEIYVIDSKTKSISRAKVVVTVPGGKNRERKNDLLVIRDNGDSFKIIHSSERDDPTTVIEREEWAKTREDMERHLSKLKDFSVSNWF